MLGTHSTLSTWFGRQCRGSDDRRARRVRVIEALEGRTLLSTLFVSSLDDSGVGTLRWAITQANLDSTSDTITFPPTLGGTISLSSVLPQLSASMIIAGSEPSVLRIRGNNLGQVFQREAA